MCKTVSLFLIIFISISIFAQQKIVINISQQQLHLYENNRRVATYPISTGIRGAGNDTFQTPLGKLRVCNKIGKYAPRGTVFKSTIPTNRTTHIYKKAIPVSQQKDLITTRIIQLQGLEPQNKNSFTRGVWIHGTPYEGNIGTSVSHGCIRMKNNDIINLFEKIAITTEVNINM